MAEHLEQLTDKCQKQVLRVYELQSDDYHMDRPLYYACQDDRENLCGEVKAGNGAVFQCLFDHLGQTDLSHKVSRCWTVCFILASSLRTSVGDKRATAAGELTE